jgi:succinyl-diaminopimelate desuccinylase
MNYSELDPVALSIELMNCYSVSPSGDESIDMLIEYLEPMGFECNKLRFNDVTNLYARKGHHGRNLCFAGHVDVVPAGDGWDSDPFKAEIRGEYLYGRGAVDMKPAIAAFIAAVSRLCDVDGSISLLISGNEEADSTYGTPKVLQWLKDKGEKIDDCIVGEPTNPFYLGEMIKIGRRGSINFDLTVFGMQGHVAYPMNAINPVNLLVFILADLKRLVLDEGNEYFPPSNLEITNLDVCNTARNVIPARASASINIRFNSLQNRESIAESIENIALNYTNNYKLNVISAFDPFFNEPGDLALIVMDVVSNKTSRDTVFGTDGGTSDARFIHQYCPIVEFGLTNDMAHKANERVLIQDIKSLTEIYQEVVLRYFACKEF